MIGALTRFTVDAMVAYINNVLQGMTTENNQPLNVPVQSSFAPEPISVPEVWIDVTPPELDSNFLGGVAGVNASTGNTLFGLNVPAMSVDFGTRSLNSLERYDLFDAIVIPILLATDQEGTFDPTARYVTELYQKTGLLPYRVTGSKFFKTHITGHGDVYESSGTILVQTLVQLEAGVNPVGSVRIVPQVVLQQEVHL